MSTIRLRSHRHRKCPNLLKADNAEKEIEKHHKQQNRLIISTYEEKKKERDRGRSVLAEISSKRNSSQDPK